MKAQHYFSHMGADGPAEVTVKSVNISVSTDAAPTSHIPSCKYRDTEVNYRIVPCLSCPNTGQKKYIFQCIFTLRKYARMQKCYLWRSKGQKKQNVGKDFAQKRSIPCYEVGIKNENKSIMPFLKGTISKFNFQILQKKKTYKKKFMFQSTQAKHTPKLQTLKRMAKFHISYK